jgi:adenine-specific DNA-methyltransferase
MKNEDPMKKLAAADPETNSPDLAAENLERLKAIFPELLTEGPDGAAVNVDVLKALVGDKTVTDANEKYGLNWHGKRRARQLALTPSTGTLRPCLPDSVDWDTTQNLMIEGDNLEVLKLLQKSYAGKVKLIYIDPPYNTGKDFVYPDDFKDNIRNYLELTGQMEGGRRISSNTEASGRFHTDWLNMMYPRLKLAHAMLRQDGVMFISIDDGEVKNLRAICDEIFGEENFVATVIWQKVYAPKSSAKHFSEDHDYIIVYAKRGETWRPVLLERTDEQNAVYRNPDADSRGPWRPNNLAARNYYSKGTYSIKCPSGRVIEGPPKGSYWRVSEEKFWEMDRDGRIWWGEDGNNVPAPKIFLSEVKAGRVPQTLWSYKEVGHNQESKKEFLDLLPITNADAVFETPKPRRLIRRMLDIATSKDGNDLVLDFFAGSGTTGDAVMTQNAADGGDRRFVSVQLPLHLEQEARLDDGTVIETLSGIMKERLRRAAKKIRDENPTFASDLGFRVFKLDSSNIRAWEPDRGDLDRTLLDHQEHLKADRTEQDILYELLLKLGLDLCVPIEAKTIAGKAVHSIGGGVLLACLATQVTRDEVELLAQGIVAWHKALTPAGDTTCVFRDSAFADDVAKTNLAAILHQHGLTTVRSL